jgi:maleylpyruvate isomerase
MSAPTPPPEIVDELANATATLLEAARGLPDPDLGGPSLCPGWTRAHVLTHVARNADGLVNLLTWARTGVETPQYPSVEARNADIEAGSARPAAEIVADLEAAAGRFAQAIAELPADRWDERVRMRSGREVPASRIPWFRLVELEVHHVDLDADYTPAHWPPDFVERMLSVEAQRLSEREGFPALSLRDVDTQRVWSIGAGGPTVTGPAAALLAWLIGRAGGDGLTVEPAGPLPSLPPWA